MTNAENDRRLEVSVEVHASPEEVWDAIATGPGVTAWMHHTEIEGRAGGRYAFDMGLGGGLNESGTVSHWEPYERFATRDVRWEPTSDGPSALLATEWLVESVNGETCVVRIVMSGFGSGQAWDDEIEGMAQGLGRSLRQLKAHLGRRPTS